MSHHCRSSAKDSHCSYCGSAYPPGAAWPRRCPGCGRTGYLNPAPVAVALQPVRHGRSTGLVVVRRSIGPARGTLALPGGFMDVGETWQQAVTREMQEETGIAADPAEVRLAGVRTALDGYLLVFGLLPARDLDRLPASAPTGETDGWEVLSGPAELGFPLHTEAAAEWFAGRPQAR